MTTQSNPNQPAVDTEQSLSLDDEQVIYYLEQHTDFFIRFPELLETLQVPHQTGEAVSLVERQIEVLREKNTQLHAQLTSLLDVAHQNNETQQSLHQLIIDVLGRTEINDALESLSRHLSEELSIDHVVLRLFSDEQHPLSDIDDQYLIMSQSARQALDDLTPSIEPFCGRLKPSQLKRLFGKNAEQIASCVLVPLRRGVLHGVIALGSEDEHRFNPGMDTLYLKRLGEMVSAALLRLIV